MKPPWGLSAGRCARFDWQGRTLCCQAFPHIGDCWRPSAEATGHPWTAVKQRAEWREYGAMGTSPHRQNGHTFHTRGFQIKRGKVECGGGAEEWSALAFVSVVFTTFHTLANLHAPQVRASAAAEQARSYVWNVSVKHSPERSTERTAPHRWCPQLSCWESVQAPRRKASPPIISCRETMWRENALTEREKKVSFLYDQS